jgi:hypothetical protein
VLKKQSQKQPNHTVNFSKVLFLKRKYVAGNIKVHVDLSVPSTYGIITEKYRDQLRRCEGPNKLTYLQTVTSKAGKTESFLKVQLHIG